jgi:hypothetical protein
MMLVKVQDDLKVSLGQAKEIFLHVLIGAAELNAQLPSGFDVRSRELMAPVFPKTSP